MNKTNHKLSNLLFAEIAKRKPAEEKIRSLVKDGANINAVNDSGDSVLMAAIWNMQDGLDIKFVYLILELGADVNYTDWGFNCLHHAALEQNVELVEKLLKAGANPNCISTKESLLDWAECDLSHEESMERKFSDFVERPGGSERMAKIVQLLKDYGAKPLSKLFVHKPEEFIEVCGYDTGLLTAKE